MGWRKRKYLRGNINPSKRIGGEVVIQMGKKGYKKELSESTCFEGGVTILETEEICQAEVCCNRRRSPLNRREQ